MTRIQEPPPEALARAKELYETGGATVAALAGMLGLSKDAFYRRVKKWGWARKSSGRGEQSAARKPAPRKPAPRPAASPPPVLPARPADTQTLIVAVRHALEGELAALRARGGEAGASDANARTLASLARTLSVLRALETDKDGGSADDENAGPLDLAELRRELARRIDLLREQRAAADPS